MNEELKVIISADTDKLKKGCQEASGSLEGLKKVGGLMGKALAVGASAAASGVVALATSAIKSYADFEQLTGGVETLFKTSADAVKKYADEAYKTAGLSANEYMETVTSFSASLIGSLGGDTAKAAEYANQAIVDMSDNANKMGTSMESIQNAYQGFAKQNYTMLDNLKLGYGGTKEEMARLIQDAAKLDSSIDANSMSFDNIVKAIHVVQTELGITGTTAKEAASTISGSIGMMKGAWSNLVVGIANENANFEALMANFIESVGTVADNLMPRIKIALEGIITLIQELLPKLLEMLLPLVMEFLPQLLETGVNIVLALVEGIAQALPQLISAVLALLPSVIENILTMLPSLIEAGVQIIVALLQGISQAIPSILQTIIKLIPSIIDALVENIPTLLQAAIDFFMTIVEAIPQILPPLLEELPTIIDKILTMLLDNLPTLLQAAVDLFNALIDAIDIIIPYIVEALPDIINSIVNALIDAIPMLLDGAFQLFMAIVKSIPKILPDLIKGLGTIVKEVKNNLVEKLKSILKFDWKLPKLKLPTVSIKGKFSLSPLEVPKFSIKWNALGGVFDKPTLFNYGGSIQGLGEDGAEAVVPLEKNTQWLDRLATMLNEKQGNGQAIILQVDGKTFAQTTINTLNDYTRQTGSLPLRLA